MTTHIWQDRGSTIVPVAAEDYVTHSELPVGCYMLKWNDMFKYFYLMKVDGYTQSSKLYGKTERHARRVIDTFKNRKNSTGVLLVGEKGSGKTLLSRVISEMGARDGISTIIVTEPFVDENFKAFVQGISQPVIFQFDEFEKVYNNDDQEQILTLLDGSFPNSNLYVFTCNGKHRVNEFMLNRPGRIFYMVEFKSLEEDFIREFCEDCLNDKSHINRIVSLASMFAAFNFDMLKAIVEEMNRYNETPDEVLELLNAKPEYAGSEVFSIECWYDGKLIPKEDTNYIRWTGNPLREINLHIGFWDQVSYDSDNDKNWKYVDLRQTHMSSFNRDGFVFTIDNRLTVKLVRDKVVDINWLAHAF